MSIAPTEVEGLAYYAGELDSDGYLKNRDNTGATTYRLFMIGLSELSSGNRASASEYFEQVGREGLFHSTEYFIAASFAERMKRDEAWTPWMVDNAVSSNK